MLELTALSPLMTILLLLAISGIVSWGLTQIVKSIIIWYKTIHQDKWWFNPIIRLTAIITGSVLGYVLMLNFLGAGIGAAGGILNTTIIAIVKSRIKSVKLGNSDTDSQEQPPAAGGSV